MWEVLHIIGKVCLFSFVSFSVLFVLSKLLGKKQIAQLDFVDYVIGISLGSIAAEMAFETDKPWYTFVIAMVIFFLLDMLISFFGRKGPFLKRILKGKPLVIIYDGELDYENLKKSKLDVNDLLALLREQGYFDIGDVKYVLFETNGNLSVMPIEGQRPLVSSDMPDKNKPMSLPNYIVVDGEISYSSLSEINRDEEWLIKKLGLKSKNELKGILLAEYDDKKNEITVHFKEN